MTSELIASVEPARKVGVMQRHIITPEYPPQPGGVSDYTAQLAAGLAAEGEDVHVWCPRAANASIAASSVPVHRDLGAVMPRDLQVVDEQLDRFPAPRRILVQWVPHGYGRRSMNIPFCLWVLRRARRHRDIVEIMVHEPFLRFERSWRQYGAALTHRIMTLILLRAATRVWFSTPQFQRLWERYKLGRQLPFQWLPIPSNIRAVSNAAAIEAIRGQYVPAGELLVGHFGTFGTPLLSVLEPILAVMSRQLPQQPLLLMGRGSREFRRRLIERYPAWENSLHATGPLSAEDLSCHVAACDLLIQPYPDGATTRRTSLMLGLSHGKAVLTTSSDATEPLWRDSGAVALTPSGGAEAFVTRLRELLQNPTERLSMSQTARKLYQNRFDISYTVAALRVPASDGVQCAS